MPLYLVPSIANAGRFPDMCTCGSAVARTVFPYLENEYPFGQTRTLLQTTMRMRLHPPIPRVNAAFTPR